MRIQKIKLYWEILFFLSGSFLLWPWFYLIAKINQFTRKNIQQKRFLIIQQSKIGDMVCTTPIFRAIKQKYPDSFLAVMIIPMTRKIIQNNPHVDEIIEYDRNQYSGIRGNLCFVREIKKRNFDWSFNMLSAGVFATVLSFWAGIPNRVTTISKEWWRATKIANWFSNYKMEYIKHTYIPRHYLRLLQFIGINNPNEQKEIFSTSFEEEKVTNIFAEQGIKNDDYIVGISLTAGNKLKEWPVDRFAALAEKIHQKLNAKIVFFGSEKDKHQVDEICGSKFISLAGKIALNELAAAMQKLDIFISGDTGPLYVANAVGTPVLDILGPVDYRIQPPLGDKCEVIKKDLPCYPCAIIIPTARKCKKGDTMCLQLISVDDVYEAVLRLKEKYGKNKK